MTKLTTILLKIAEIEDLHELALADPVEGVVLGDQGCGVWLNYYEGKWHLVVLDGRMIYTNEWFENEKDALFATLSKFRLTKKVEEYVKEFFDEGNADERKKNA